MESVQSIISSLVAASTCINLSGDSGNSGINFVDRHENQFYKITDHVGTQRLLAALDNPYNADAREQARFAERTYYHVSGINVHLSGYDPGRLSDICRMIYVELGRVEQEKNANWPGFTTPMRFYFTYDILTIPQVRMTCKSRVNFVARLQRRCASSAVKIKILFVNTLTYPTALLEMSLNEFGEPTVQRIDVRKDAFMCASISVMMPVANMINIELLDEPIEIPPLEDRDMNIVNVTKIPEVYFAYELVHMIEQQDPAFFADNIMKIASCLLFRHSNTFYVRENVTPLREEFLAVLDHLIRTHATVGEFAGRSAEAIKDELMTRFTNTSVANLVFWARTRNLKVYEVILTEYVSRRIKGYVRRSDITLTDYSHVMFFLGCHRYGVQSRDGRQFWFEFLNDSSERAKLYKWIPVQAENVMITTMIGALRTRIAAIVDSYQKMLTINDVERRNRRHFIDDAGWLSPDVEDRKLTAEDLGAVITRLHRSDKFIADNGHTPKFIKPLTSSFDRTDFFNAMNRDPNIIGVHGGVLELARNDGVFHDMRLREEYHEHACSWSAGGRIVDYQSAAVRELLVHWNSYFVEGQEVADWTRMFLSQGMDGNAKATFMLIWTAQGSRAKTFWSELTMNALSLSEGGAEDAGISGYATKVNNMIFTDEGRTAHGHTTALIKVDGKRAGVLSEGPKDKQFATHVLKMFFGQEAQSGRQIHDRERNFKINLMLWYVTNHAPKLDSVDYGSRRRLIMYEPKYMFLDNPDPTNPMQRKADPKFSKSLKDQPEFKNAWLTILAHSHRELQLKYAGDMEKVPLPAAIMSETSRFIYDNDPIYQFAVECLVRQTNFRRNMKTPVGGKSYIITDTEFKNRYAEWCQARAGADQRTSFARGISNHGDSFIGKWIYKSDYGEYTVEGLAFIARDADGAVVLADGECRFTEDEWRTV